MPKPMMRPTAVKAQLSDAMGGDSILMIGGNEERDSWSYSINQNKHFKLPKLPAGHNITVNICVNFHNKAIFTFIHDAKLAVKIAVMDLTALNPD